MKKGSLQKTRTGTFPCRTSTESRGEKRKTRHEEDARKRNLAQRTTAAGEAAADHGADGGDETAAAGGGANAGENTADAVMEADKGAEAEGGGAREPRAPAKSTTPKPQHKEAW